MDIAWVTKNIAGAVMLPPLNAMLLIALALLLRARQRLAWSLVGVGLALLAVQSLKPVGQWLLAPIEAAAGSPVILPDQLRSAGAVVILGGGRYRNAPEFGADTVASETLVRLRYGARLARESGLPVLMSGGNPDGSGISEAAAMAQVFREWQLPVRWIEGDSSDTADNAAGSARLLKSAGISRVLLVTQAFHMPRARRSLEATGLQVIPAATDFYAQRPLALPDYLPQAEGMRWVRWGLRERIGQLWYRWRHD